MKSHHIRLPQHSSFRPRSGLSLLEVVIVLGCGLMLLAVIVPIIFQHRETQRYLACQNRIRSLSIGMSSWSKDHGDRFPPLVSDGVPWTVEVLPFLEGIDPALLALPRQVSEEPVRATAFLCPDGQQYAAGSNCYVVNGGWGNFVTDETGLVSETSPHGFQIDLDHDGEISQLEILQTRATGVVWRSASGLTSWSRDEINIRDGLSQTIVLTESLRSRSWRSQKTFDLAFVVGLDRLEWGTPPHQFQVDCSSLGPYAINSSRGEQESHSPAPGSLHPGGVNVLFADGSFRMLSQEIDPRLYLRLMTPGGSLFGESPIRQASLPMENPDRLTQPSTK